MGSGRHGRRVMRRTKRCTGKAGPQYTCCSSANPPAADPLQAITDESLVFALFEEIPT